MVKNVKNSKEGGKIQEVTVMSLLLTLVGWWSGVVKFKGLHLITLNAWLRSSPTTKFFFFFGWRFSVSHYHNSLSSP